MTDRLLARIEALAVAAGDHHEFRRHADPVLRKAVGYDIAAWASMDPATHLFTSCDIISDFGEAPHEISAERELFAYEFADVDPLTYTKIIRSGRNVARLRAQVDDPMTVGRYRSVLAPGGAHDEMRVVLSDPTGVWGTVTLYRAEWWEPFGREAERTMSALAPALAAVFRHAFLIAGVAWGDRPPGALTLSKTGVLEATSEPAERWLDTVRPEDLKALFATLIGGLEHDPLVRATVTGAEGPITFHSFLRKGDADLVDVVVEQPRPAELAEIIMAAHGLTPREAEVTRCVMQGMTTRLIANTLSISEYTVQDHLKAVFGKFSVVTRGELLHEVYSTYYAPQRELGATPGPYGYFID